MSIGERIKEYRRAEGLSQEQMAEALMVSRQAITKWETGKGLPDIDNLIALSKIMGLTLDELVLNEAEIGEEHSEKKSSITRSYFANCESICTMYEYFDIFLARMIMCSHAARILNAQFSLKVNGQRVL